MSLYYQLSAQVLNGLPVKKTVFEFVGLMQQCTSETFFNNILIKDLIMDKTGPKHVV
jgi:hypothetical protein